MARKKALKTEGEAPAAAQPVESVKAAVPVQSENQSINTKAAAKQAAAPADVKATAKAAPKAAGGKGAQKQATPPPPPPPVEEKELTKTQKKNQRVYQKRAEAREAQQAVEEAKAQTQELMKKYKLDSDPAHVERLKIFADLTKQFEDLEDMATMDKAKVLKAFIPQRQSCETLLESIAATITEQQAKTKKPENRRLSSEQLIGQVMELEMADTPDVDTIKWIREQVSVAFNFESMRKLVSDLTELKANIEERIKSNARYLEKAREWDRSTRTLRKVCDLKGIKADELPATATIKTVTVDLTPDVASAISENLILRKLERTHGVIADKGSKFKGLTISGLEKDVNEAAAFLKGLDFTGKTLLNVDNRTAGLIIGKGGATVRKIEEEYKVYVHSAQERLQVTLYGSKENVAKVLKFIQAQVDDQSQAVETYLNTRFARALVGSNGQTIKAIEQASGTSIKVQLGGNNAGKADAENDKPGKAGQTRVTIRGKREEVATAKKKIDEFIATLTVVEVTAEKAAIIKLFSSNTRGDEKRGEDTGRRETTKLADEFAELREKSGVSIIREGEKLVLVSANKEAVASAKASLLTLLEHAAYTKDRIPVGKDQIRVLTAEQIALLSKNSGASLSVVRDRRAKEEEDQKVYVDIYGSAEAKAAGKAALEKYLSTEAVIETVSLSVEVVNVLLARGGAKIRDLEERTGAAVTIEKVDKKALGAPRDARVMGPKAAVAKALDRLTKMQKDAETHAANAISKEIEIPKDAVRMVIGSKGLVINGLRSTRGMDQVNVNDSDDKAIVVLKGSADAVAKVEEQINNIVKKSKGEVIAEAPAADPDTAPASASGEARPTSNRKENNKGGKKQKEFEMTDDSLFPSLGATVTRGAKTAVATPVEDQATKDCTTEVEVPVA